MVLDQTNLALPGVRVDVYRGDQVIETTVTGGDGTFDLSPGPDTDMVEAAALVRAYLLQSRGFARRVKDRWMRLFPSLPKAA